MRIRSDPNHEGDEGQDHSHYSQAGLVQSIKPGPSVCYHVRARAADSSVSFLFFFLRSTISDLVGRRSYP